MKELKLNESMGKYVVATSGYKLDPSEKYVIDLNIEIEKQMATLQAVQMFGLNAMNDWHMWLSENDFNPNMPNPTNEFVSRFYGKKELWKTELSQGLVVKNKDDDDFYILMECSRENEGFKYSQIVVTLGGCL